MTKSETIEALQDRIEELEGLLGASVPVAAKYRALGIPKYAAPAFGLLMKREIMSREQLHVAMYGARIEDCQPNLHTVDLAIHSIRKALKPHGIRVRTHWGLGWSLSNQDKIRIDDLIRHRGLEQEPQPRQPSTRQHQLMRL